MKKTKLVLNCALALLLIAPGVLAQSSNFTEHKLKNGLRIILAEDHTAPTYSIAVTYNVGSRDERPGRTGFAHLFEHMMFQGSENIGKGEHFLTVFNNGGNMNGTTNADRTNYYQTLPANQIDLGLFLEADRMRSLVINQANLDNQRATVQEERRQSYDNQPYGKTSEAILETVYENFGYKHSTIGSMEDLSAATLQDVSSFFKTYYAPNNAVLTIVGDFKTSEILEKIERYFVDIPQQTPPPAPDMTEPKQTAEKRKTIEDPLAQVARLDIVFKIPAGNTPDWYALEVAARVLADGQSSRLYQKLVKEKQVALSVSAGPHMMRGPSMFTVIAMVAPGKDPAEVEKLVYEEFERMKTEIVTDQEMEKVKMSARREDVEEQAGTLGRAVNMGYFAVAFNDPGLLNNYGKKVTSVTRQQIQQAMKTYVIETNRSVILTVPKPRTAPGGGR